jgi:hypothetical protein
MSRDFHLSSQAVGIVRPVASFRVNLARFSTPARTVHRGLRKICGAAVHLLASLNDLRGNKVCAAR